MIEDSAKSSLDVVAVLEDVGCRMCDAHPPEATEMTWQRMLVEDGRAFVRVICTRFGNAGVGGAFRVRAIGAVDTNSAFSFAHSPLKGGKDEALNEVDEKARKVDVKAFHFFFDEFGFDVGVVVADGGVIVVLVTSRNFCSWGCEMAFQRDAFRGNAKGARVIR